MPLFTDISKLDRCEIIALTNALSVALAEGLDMDDLNMLGNILATIGSFLMTFGSISTATDKPDTNSQSDIPSAAENG